VSNVKVNQWTARDRCRSQNADLVSINDADENKFVKDTWSVNSLN